MRKLTLKDILPTLIVAAVVIPSIGYLVRGSMPFVHDPQGMAGVGVAGFLLTFAALGRDALGTGANPDQGDVPRRGRRLDPQAAQVRNPAPTYPERPVVSPARPLLSARGGTRPARRR